MREAWGFTGSEERGLSVSTSSFGDTEKRSSAQMPSPYESLYLSLRGLLVLGVSLVCDQAQSTDTPGPAICRAGLGSIKRQAPILAFMMREDSACPQCAPRT